jgi:uroporphyrinogen decarboxylase
MMTSRDRFLAAAACRPVDRAPIWVMRQAGRYLPEYRALKAKHDFLTMVRTPELALEVTLQPLRRYNLDAAILFSDILVIPEALGQGYHFRDQGGIGMEYALETAAQIDALDASRVREKLDYVPAAIRLIRKELGHTKALLGFAGTPWTLAAYMVDGGSSDDFPKLKALARTEPVLFGKLMDKLADAVAEYLKMQIEAGADAVQLFDSWAALCQGVDYEKFSLRYIRRIIAALPAGFPVIVYAKGMAQHAGAIAGAGAKVIGVDWTYSLAQVRGLAGAGVALQGNLDPQVMTTTPEIVRAAALAVLADNAGAPGHIFNLGHGITPGAKLECMQALVDTVTGA